MAYELPPPPSNAQSGSFAWYDWYTKLRDYVLNLAVTHNTLDGLQGGTTNEYYHLTSTQHTSLLAVYQNTNTSDNSITTTSFSRYLAVNAPALTTTYSINAEFILGSSLSTTGFQIKIEAPTGSTVSLDVAVIPDVVSTSATYVKRTTTNDSYLNFTTTNMTSCSNAKVIVTGYCATASTSSDVLLTIKQSAEIATALTVLRGSSFRSYIPAGNI